mmetsp:Transcript_38065/g.65282  ORF Transcript_38065/g.65282 Transcript_38065/m.65282 type:complete len:253 (-) Transcript_38065:253-1011(-)
MAIAAAAQRRRPSQAGGERGTTRWASAAAVARRSTRWRLTPHSSSSIMRLLTVDCIGSAVGGVSCTTGILPDRVRVIGIPRGGGASAADGSPSRACISPLTVGRKGRGGGGSSRRLACCGATSPSRAATMPDSVACIGSPGSIGAPRATGRFPCAASSPSRASRMPESDGCMDTPGPKMPDSVGCIGTPGNDNSEADRERVIGIACSGSSISASSACISPLTVGRKGTGGGLRVDAGAGAGAGAAMAGLLGP